MARRSVGLVLRSKSVEVLEARRGFHGIQVSKLVSVPLQGTEDAQVADAIRTALSQAGVRAAQVGVSVPSQDVLLRSFSMPLLPKSELNAAVQFEARKYIPFKMQELIWSFHPEEQRATKQMSVAFVGIRAETFARIQRWLSEAGVKPAFVEAQSVSLARVVAETRKPASVPEAATQPAHQFVGIIDIDVEANVAHIVIAKGAVPYFAREVTLKRDGTGQEPHVTAMDPRAEILLSELRLSVDFFTRENPHTAIQQLILFGDQLVIGSWASSFSEPLHCPVAIGTLPTGNGSSQPLNLHFACAVGLVFRDLRPSKVRLEFQERPVAKAASKTPLLGFATKLDPEFFKAMVKPAVAQAIIAALVIGLIAALGEQRVFATRQRLQMTVKNFPDVGWDLKSKSMKELKPIQQQVDTRLGVLRTITSQMVSMTEKLDVMAKRIPDGVWLEGFKYEQRLDRTGESQQSLMLQGACFRPGQGGELDAIREFSDQLKADQRFFKGFSVSRLAEVGTEEHGRSEHQVSYRTFKLNYQSQRRL